MIHFRPLTWGCLDSVHGMALAALSLRTPVNLLSSDHIYTSMHVTMLRCCYCCLCFLDHLLYSGKISKVIETLELFVDLLSSATRGDNAASAPLLGHSKKITIQFAFRKACKKTDKIRSLFSEWTIFQNKQCNTRLGSFATKPRKLYLLYCEQFNMSCGV